MPSIEISQEAFTRMVIIHAKDNLTHQALALTPAEAAELRDMLNTIDIEGVDDATMNLEAARLKALTIYNGHSLPSVERQQFEAKNEVGPHFDLEVKAVVREEEP